MLALQIESYGEDLIPRMTSGIEEPCLKLQVFDFTMETSWRVIHLTRRLRCKTEKLSGIIDLIGCKVLDQIFIECKKKILMKIKTLMLSY